MAVSNEMMKDMYTRMLRIRDFENATSRLYAEGKIPGFCHLYIGEEAVATGVCECLTDEDFLCGTQTAFSGLAQIIMLLIIAAPIGLTRGIKLIHVLLQVRHPLGGGGAQFHPLLNIAGVIVEGSVKVLHQLRRHHFV